MAFLIILEKSIFKKLQYYFNEGGALVNSQGQVI
jgi:hypothetical protein